MATYSSGVGDRFLYAEPDLRLKHWPRVVVGWVTAFKNSADIFRARSPFQTYWPHVVVGWVTALNNSALYNSPL